MPQLILSVLSFSDSNTVTGDTYRPLKLSQGSQVVDVGHVGQVQLAQVARVDTELPQEQVQVHSYRQGVCQGL